MHSPELRLVNIEECFLKSRAICAHPVLGRTNFKKGYFMQNMNLTSSSVELGVEVFTPYITKNGRRIYRKDGKMWHFFADPSKRKVRDPEDPKNPVVQ